MQLTTQKATRTIEVNYNHYTQAKVMKLKPGLHVSYAIGPANTGTHMGH